MAAEEARPEHERARAPGWEQGRRAAPAVLLSIVLVIATAGLVYELVIAAVASYVLGDSVTQFSLVIGVYLSALGLGAYVSRFIEQRLAAAFVSIELAAALLGGFSAPGLFLVYSYTSAFGFILYALCIAVGVLVGLELPLLIRILREQLEFKELIAKALTFDYAGALLGSLAFSLLLVPQLGLVRTSLACGFLNAAVAFGSTYVLDPERKHPRVMQSARVQAVFVLLLLAVGLLQAERLLELSEARIFGGTTLVSQQSRYQRIVVSQRGDALELHLNGNLQFSSRDEHRYHEALVHPALASAAARRHVLIGGGGDGLAAREVLAWKDVERVTLVDLDPSMTELFRTHPALTRLNRGALSDPRLEIVNDDAFVWLAQSTQEFDAIVFDFPDPSNYSLGKLYSERLYKVARERLRPGGALVVQATSPLFAPSSYWCIVRTIESAGLHVLPYHVFVPAFGEWGYVLAKREPFSAPSSLPEELAPRRYLDAQTLRTLFLFPPDMQRVETDVNRLNNQALVSYYVSEWAHWN